MKVGRKPWIVKKRAQRLDLNLKLPHRRVVPRRAARASDLPPIDARTVGTVQSNRVDVEGFCFAPVACSDFFVVLYFLI